MTVGEIITMFKVVGQTKGLDTYRFINDEDICTYIYEAIVNKVRAVVSQSSLMQYPSKANIQDNSISGTNILRNLYKVVSTSIENEDDVFNVDTDEQSLDCTQTFFTSTVMFITAIDVKYNSGEVVNCRLVDPDKFYLLDDDYCNRASWRSPIVTYLIEQTNDGENYKILGMYGSRSFPTAKVPEEVKIHYIATPSKLYDESSTSNEDYHDLDYYDIPDYAIPEIVDIAVNAYFKSVGATSSQVEQIRRENQND